MRLVLLPGLDGTGRLFERFVAAAPPGVIVTPIALPCETTALDDRVAALLPDRERFVLLAESYSSALAVRLAERCDVAGLVIVNGFVSPPRWGGFRCLVSARMFAMPLPRGLLRALLVGRAASDALVDDVVAAVRSVPAPVLAHRLREVLRGDGRDAFARLPCRVLYLRGTEDRLVSDMSWKRMAALRPMDLARVKGPHLLLQASPAASWDAIAPFLAAAGEAS